MSFQFFVYEGKLGNLETFREANHEFPGFHYIQGNLETFSLIVETVRKLYGNHKY